MDGPEPFRRYRASRHDPIKQPERRREEDWQRLTETQRAAIAAVLDGSCDADVVTDEVVATFIRRWHG